jgi:hypothetical protein
LLRALVLRGSWIMAGLVLLAACAAPQAEPAPAPSVPSITAASTVGLPLEPLEVLLAGIAHAGPAELRLTDAQGREAGSYLLDLAAGGASLTVLPRGALGPQRAQLVAGGRVLAEQPALFTLDAQTTLRTGQPRLDELYPAIRRVMAGATLGYTLDGGYVHGYRSPDSPLIWLRDHAYQGRGFRYFEPDLKSVPEAFRRAQRPDGSLPDFLARPERGVEAARMDVEADVEFLYALAVHDAWQATGDDAWMREMLPSVERAIAYSTSDPLRWDAERRLLRRPFTIDMWDFQYGPTTADPRTGKPAPRHWIDGQTRWAFFHGDNLGLAYSMKLLGRMYAALGDAAAAERWDREGVSLRGRINSLAWNGRFYTHMVFLEPFDVPGVDEAEQLSLSNAFNLNRDIRRNHARAIIEQYFARSTRRGQAFAEWYGIDPPFPAGAFGLAGKPGERPGEYTNGGIMPLVGGELARGAFRYGAEVYGFETLARYHTLLVGSGASYLWYYNPVGNPGISGPDTIPSDGWGASAMLGALLEGAAGIEDESRAYRELTLSPRWSAAPDLREVYAVARYAASDGYVAYRWQRLEDRIRLELTGSGEHARLHLLLPPGTSPRALLIDGAAVEYAVEDIYGSIYVEASLDRVGGTAELLFE